MEKSRDSWSHINMQYECKKIDKACDDYKLVFESKNNKYKYLPDSISKQANSFKKELLAENKYIFDKYPKGTLVYVEFGVNTGSEISGNHFAFTLDKIDKKSKRTITVVPLSSKHNRHYINIPMNLYGVAEVNITNTSISFTDAELFQFSNEISKIRNRYKRYDKNESYACINMIQTVSKEKINRINRFDPSGKIVAPPEIMNLINQALIKEYI